MLSINIFFCLILPTQLLRNVKASHHVDLAYLYYLPFCSVFTSNDNFHAQVVPLFLRPDQTFVNGIELKDDLKKLNERYSSLDESEFNLGMTHFARYPPDDTSFLTTRLWDRHVSNWRNPTPPPNVPEELQRALGEIVNKLSKSSEAQPHDIRSIDQLGYVSMEHKIHLRRGKWRRFSVEMEQRIIARENVE